MVEDMSSPPTMQTSEVKEIVATEPEVKEPVKGAVNKQNDMLTAEDLIGGSDIIHKVKIESVQINGMIKIKPVTLKVVKLASKAAGGNEDEMSRYLIKQALIEPKMSDDQIENLLIGTVQVISGKINEISGITKEMIAAAKNS